MCEEQTRLDRLTLAIIAAPSFHFSRLVISAFLLVAGAALPLIDLVALREVVLLFSFHVFHVGLTCCVFMKIDSATCNAIRAKQE